MTNADIRCFTLGKKYASKTNSPYHVLFYVSVLSFDIYDMEGQVQRKMLGEGGLMRGTIHIIGDPGVANRFYPKGLFLVKTPFHTYLSICIVR